MTPTARQQEIIRLIECGLKVIQLRPRSKAPLKKGWQRTPGATVDEVLRWPETANVGLQTGITFDVRDSDHVAQSGET
jgi:hypothetical protein